MRLSKDLQALVEYRNSPILINAVEQAMDSIVGERNLWVFVEGLVDELFCKECLFDSNKTQIVIAGRQNRSNEVNGGKANVCRFTKYFVQNNINTNVLGIVDQDYSHFSSSEQEILPDRVLETDAHDIEMTLWMNQSVQKAMMSDSLFSDAWTISEPVVRYMGLLRVADAWTGTNVAFPKHWKTSKFYVEGKLRDNWKEIILRIVHDVRGNQTIDFSDRQLELTETKWNVSTMDISLFGRGHDVFGFTSTVIGRQASHSERMLVLKMMESLSVEDLKTWNLYKQIDTEYLKY